METFTLAIEADRLNAIYRFVRSHGFRATITNVVTVWIPYTSPYGNGEETYTIRTMDQARKVLGY